jgi:hypothetical protein
VKADAPDDIGSEGEGDRLPAVNPDFSGDGPAVSESWMDNFFLFGDPVERRALRVESRGVDRERSFRIRTGREIPGTPMMVVSTAGAELRDFLWPGSIVPVLVRTRVVDLFVSEAITGWVTYPVDLIGRDDVPIPDYLGFSVVGRCGKLEEPTSEPGRDRFDHATGDGSDFFQPENSGQRFITSRAELAMRIANVRNVWIEPLADAERPFV